MNVLERLLGKKKSLDSAATEIVRLERSLAEKEAELTRCRQAQKENIKAKLLGGEDDSRNRNRLEIEITQLSGDVEALKDILVQAKGEVVEIAKGVRAKKQEEAESLFKQRQNETKEVTTKMAELLKEVLILKNRLEGRNNRMQLAHSVPFPINIPPLPIDVTQRINEELEAVLRDDAGGMLSGPDATREKANALLQWLKDTTPEQMVESALATARN